MKKKTLLGLLVLVFASLYCFASVDIEIPIDINLGLSEIPSDGHESYSTFYPYFTMGPVRASYIFDDFTGKSDWTFGCGAGFFPWPFQACTLTASAFYTVCRFSNGGYLDLAGLIDFGLLWLISGYYDVTSGKTINQAYFGPAGACSLNVYYRHPEKMAFYCGAGFNISCGGMDNSAFFLYTLNLSMGWRISTKAKN
ncbi:MAG: hypothetical protein K5839_05835 [Treponemataceae bacterium]|nr:hypothetical protein [Treponemataceae bacterium]